MTTRERPLPAHAGHFWDFFIFLISASTPRYPGRDSQIGCFMFLGKSFRSNEADFASHTMTSFDSAISLSSPSQSRAQDDGMPLTKTEKPANRHVCNSNSFNRACKSGERVETSTFNKALLPQILINSSSIEIFGNLFATRSNVQPKSSPMSTPSTNSFSLCLRVRP